jgi:hypothetical protein
MPEVSCELVQNGFPPRADLHAMSNFLSDQPTTVFFISVHYVRKLVWRQASLIEEPSVWSQILSFSPSFWNLRNVRPSLSDAMVQGAL